MTKKPITSIIKAHLAAIAALLLLCPAQTAAQVGEHRNDLSIGFGGGLVMGSIGFTPKVTQSQHIGYTAGLQIRYVCEKYFNSICSLCAEINYTQAGWKEDIKTEDEQPVINPATEQAEKYSRTLNYLQVPFLAHLAWGKEQKGLQFFFELGPQFGYLTSESTKMNFDLSYINLADRANQVYAQDSMAVEHKLDYGIVAGAGVELSVPKVGHFQLGARYYYGLGNIYGDTKRDYFAKSNHAQITVRLAYLFDLTRTKQ